MNTALAHKLIEITGDFVRKQASNAEAQLMREMSSLFSKGLADLLQELKATGALGNSSIAAAERRLRSLKNPMANTILGSSSKLLSPENRKAAQALSDRAFTASQRTLDRMIGNVTENLRTSFVEGLGINEAARSLSSEFRSMTDFELRRVARTETHTAQMNEKFSANVKNELVQYQQWISAEDDRTRDGTYGVADHVSMNGQIVAVGKPFSNGLLYPGDMGGDIEEWINCRCRLVPFTLPPGKMAPPDMEWFYEEDLEDSVVGAELAPTPDSPYKNISEMMRDILSNHGEMNGDDIIGNAKRFFPDTKFSKTHLSWYKSQFKKGTLKPWEGISKFPTGTPPEPGKTYSTIADLMRDVLFSEKFKGMTDEEVIALVKGKFPSSKYNINHLRWYKNQAKKGKFNPVGTVARQVKKPKPLKPLLKKPLQKKLAYDVAKNDYAEKAVLKKKMVSRIRVLKGSAVKKGDHSFGAVEEAIDAFPSEMLDKLKRTSVAFSADKDSSVLGDYSLWKNHINIFNNSVFRGDQQVRKTMIHEMAHVIDHRFHTSVGWSLTGGSGSANKTVDAGRKIINAAFDKQQDNILGHVVKSYPRTFNKLIEKRPMYGGGFGEEWKNVPSIQIKGKMVSKYATRDKQEFFAESVADYYNGGVNVKALSEELYTFIKEAIFAGKEFPISIRSY